MSIRNLDPLFGPASIAVFGASPRLGSVGATVWRNLRQGGFKGPLKAVNPETPALLPRPKAPADGSRASVGIDTTAVRALLQRALADESPRHNRPTPWLAHAPPTCLNRSARRPGHRLLAGATAALMAALAALAGCSSPPLRPADPARPSPGTPQAGLPPGMDPGRDGPGAKPPPDLLQVPDAEPRLELVRPGGANKPYETLGQAYLPLTGDPPLLERGLATWYGRKFHGRTTANGETYNMYAMTAAHKTMPLPSYARVRNPANGREVVVRVNDRGPFHRDRVIDLSYTAALKLGVLGGAASVEIERITYEAIRAGSWRTPANLASMVVPATASIPAAALPDAAPPLPAETQATAQPAAKAARGFWLQLGAFAQRDGALGFQQRVAGEVAWLAPLLAIFNERQLHRLQAGPYASRSDARQAADRLREALNLIPAVVERR